MDERGARRLYSPAPLIEPDFVPNEALGGGAQREPLGVSLATGERPDEAYRVRHTAGEITTAFFLFFDFLRNFDSLEFISV